ncbi:MAG TPA: branched-chain amino acid ABC transporter permease [Acidimicrobiales bacterium]|nr:branched-chain amino acid ABC transporter permease [Acidimicrobiales bacterium]
MSNLADQFWPYTVDGLTVGAIYALVALGYTMVYGVLRLINFAHSEVFMIGTVGALLAADALGVDAPRAGMSLVLTILACTLAAMLAGGTAAVVLERVAYRPLRRRGASRLAALISAIGASFFLQELFARWRGRDNEAYAEVLRSDRLFTLFGADVTNRRAIAVVAAVVMMVALDQLVARTRLGRGIRSVAQDPETATLMGVDIDRVVLATFLLGGLMAGAAAELHSLLFPVTRYDVGFIFGIKAFTAAVLGGIGNLRGALVGGFLLGLFENWGAAVWSSEWKDVIAFGVLVVVLMFRPTGILGESVARSRA